MAAWGSPAAAASGVSGQWEGTLSTRAESEAFGRITISVKSSFAGRIDGSIRTRDCLGSLRYTRRSGSRYYFRTACFNYAPIRLTRLSSTRIRFSDQDPTGFLASLRRTP